MSPKSPKRWSINLIEELREFGDVAHIVRRQFRDGNFVRRINTKVQLAPAAACPDAHVPGPAIRPRRKF